MYIAIMKVENNRIAKYKDFDTQAESDAHVSGFISKFPSAFVYNNVSNIPYRDLWIVGTTVTTVPFIEPVDINALKAAAEKAELMKMININTGTTPEAAAYQAEKVKQNLSK